MLVATERYFLFKYILDSTYIVKLKTRDKRGNQKERKIHCKKI